ncbi:MAG TPA: transglutaminaseTgpA domain-containing protein [Polyangiaceae bacterium]|jgi:transglutaminase-like putative cysteine protease|nr:transglutaminaseTgpA domain-containing protein [Polyangiaceae bacterium]
MTDALAALGVLALVSSGELDRWLGYGCLIGLVVAVLIPDDFQDRPVMRRFAMIAPLGLFGLQIARLASGAELLPVAIEFAATLQVVRLATRRGAAHDQQVIVLALIHLIAGTVLGGGLAYGLCFLGFLVVAPGALVLSHLRREVEGNYRQGARDRTGLPVDVPRILRSRRVIGRPFLAFTCLLSLPIFVFTAVLFVLFPRVGLSLLLLNHSRPERMVGFSDKVDLGGVGKLRSDPTIVLRVDVPNLPATPPPRLALYLKGTAFDRYDGRSWSRSLPANRTPAEQRGRSVRILRYPELHDRKLRVDLEPIDPQVVFLPIDAVALTLVTPVNAAPAQIPELYSGSEGGFSYRTPDDRGLRYEVSLAGAGDAVQERGLGSEQARYLALPSNLPSRIHELAREWTRGTSDPQAQANLIEGKLRRDYRYDLDSPSGASKNPLDHFLFVSKRGHCEFYSTAMAVLLRSLGVPTRNVTGFIGGTYNRFSRSYAVRQGDAHSWVEVYLPARGWTRFDPTPPTSSAPRSEIHGLLATLRDIVEATAQRWNRHVINYDLKQQIGLFRSVRDQYQHAVDRAGFVGKLLQTPRRAIVGLLALIALGFLARSLLRKRRIARRPSKVPSSRELASRRIVELYRALELSLIARGVPRPSGTPPLLHAQSLVAMGHPVADEALALTEQYLRVRFGGEALDDAERRQFAERVRAIKHARVERPAA